MVGRGDEAELAARRGCLRFATIGFSLIAIAATIVGIILLPKLRRDPRVEPDFQRVEAAFEPGVAKGTDDEARALAHDLRALAHDPGAASIVLIDRGPVTRACVFVRLSERPSKKERLVLAAELVEGAEKRLPVPCSVYAEVRAAGDALRWARGVRAANGDSGLRTGSGLLADPYVQGSVASIGSIR